MTHLSQVLALDTKTFVLDQPTMTTWINTQSTVQCLKM